jgi:hypothetical protein
MDFSIVKFFKGKHVLLFFFTQQKSSIFAEPKKHQQVINPSWICSIQRMIICVVTLQHFVSKQCIIAIRVGFSSIAHMHIHIQTLSL